MHMHCACKFSQLLVLASWYSSSMKPQQDFFPNKEAGMRSMEHPLVPHALLDRPEGDVLLLMCGLLTLRTEAAYVLPWVAHHKLMGVDHMLLYHDDASGSWHPKLAIAHKKLLTHLASDESVTFLSMREHNLSSQAQQIGHCTNLTSEIAASARHAGAAAWVGNWDMDEVPVMGAPSAGSHSGELPSLKALLQTLPLDTAGMYVPRFTFGAAPSAELPAAGLLEYEQWTQRLNWHPKGKSLWRAGKAYPVVAGHSLAMVDSSRQDLKLVLPDGTEATSEWFRPREDASGPEDAHDDASSGRFAHFSEQQRAMLVSGQEAIPSVAQPLRLCHFELRSVAECRRKQAMFNEIPNVFPNKTKPYRHDAFSLPCALRRNSHRRALQYVVEDSSALRYAEAVREALGKAGRRILRDEQRYLRSHLSTFLVNGTWDF